MVRSCRDATARRLRRVVTADHRTRTTYAVGVDPGTSTGLTVLRGDGFKMHVQQGTPSQVLDDLALRFPFLVDLDADVLVGCERYVDPGGGAPGQRRTAQPTAQQTIGIVAQLARFHGWAFRLQAPADVKALVPNSLLRDLDLWTTARDVEQRDANDANDSCRHALATLAFHRASLFDRLLTRTGVV